MGVEYYVGCRDCKVMRGLDKLSPVYPRTLKDAHEVAGQMKLFNTALLVGFLVDHQGHNVTMWNDSADQDSIHNYKWEEKDLSA